MSRKKLDKRIPTLIENGVALGHRSLFLITGDKAAYQVVILHNLLMKALVTTNPKVLWCYKKELAFISHQKKRMHQIHKKMKTGKFQMDEGSQFDLFVSSTEIHKCYYSKTHKILGNTYSMCILQDFEALTPNLLARTIETVAGGGIIVILLKSITSKKQFCAMAMDVHSRYRNEAHNDVVGRFNERFLLSLVSCHKSLLLDDNLNVLPFSTHCLKIDPVTPKIKDASANEDEELKELQESLQDTQPVGVVVDCCKTLDQAKALLKFVDAISEKTLSSTVTLTAARGRGKSAALGLAIAAAVAFDYSNIFVTSPSPENLSTLFEFVFRGFDVLEYQEHEDYTVEQSTNPEFRKAVVRVNISKNHRQTIQYIHPSDGHKLGQAELVVIDEAAAIPLPLVRNLLGPYLVFMASTISGYEGTGRSLSLKLIDQLRQQSATFGGKVKASNNSSKKGGSETLGSGRALYEIHLNRSIRYRSGDDVEQWLNGLLCLDATIGPRTGSCHLPSPQDCELYYINRDTLFSFCKASELFLQRIMALFVASHYKNSPNDLQMLSDAPAHHLFCLLGPIDPSAAALPEVLCVLHVCLEGELSKSHVMSSLSRGKKDSGNLIPWTISQKFQDSEFYRLSGARVVEIATNPEYQRMGYDARALQLLHQYYEGEVVCMENSDDVPQEIESMEDESVGLLTEQLNPRKSLPPLLLNLSERPAEKLDYIGVSYGLTLNRHDFWKKSGYLPVYLRQTNNEITGEHTCIMLKALHQETTDISWLTEFWDEFRREFVNSLCYEEFRELATETGLSVLRVNSYRHTGDDVSCTPSGLPVTPAGLPMTPATMTAMEVDSYFTKYNVKDLDLYAKNMVDYYQIRPLLKTLAKLYFLLKLGDVDLDDQQASILLGIGLQHKSVEKLSTELGLPVPQVMALFNRSIRKIVQHLYSIKVDEVSKTMPVRMESFKYSKDNNEGNGVQSEDAGDAKPIKKLPINLEHLSHYAIKGSEDEWSSALATGAKGSVSVKSSEKRKLVTDTTTDDSRSKKQKKFKRRK